MGRRGGARFTPLLKNRPAACCRGFSPSAEQRRSCRGTRKKTPPEDVSRGLLGNKLYSVCERHQTRRPRADLDAAAEQTQSAGVEAQRGPMRRHPDTVNNNTALKLIFIITIKACAGCTQTGSNSISMYIGEEEKYSKSFSVKERLKRLNKLTHFFGDCLASTSVVKAPYCPQSEESHTSSESSGSLGLYVC